MGDPPVVLLDGSWPFLGGVGKLLHRAKAAGVEIRSALVRLQRFEASRRCFAWWLVATDEVALSAAVGEVPWERSTIVERPTVEVVADLRTVEGGAFLVLSSASVITGSPRRRGACTPVAGPFRPRSPIAGMSELPGGRCALVEAVVTDALR